MCHLDTWVTLKKKNTDTICQNSEVHVFTDIALMILMAGVALVAALTEQNT